MSPRCYPRRREREFTHKTSRPRWSERMFLTDRNSGSTAVGRQIRSALTPATHVAFTDRRRASRQRVYPRPQGANSAEFPDPARRRTGGSNRPRSPPPAPTRLSSRRGSVSRAVRTGSVSVATDSDAIVAAQGDGFSPAGAVRVSRVRRINPRVCGRRPVRGGGCAGMLSMGSRRESS